MKSSFLDSKELVTGVYVACGAEVCHYCWLGLRNWSHFQKSLVINLLVAGGVNETLILLIGQWVGVRVAKLRILRLGANVVVGLKEKALHLGELLNAFALPEERLLATFGK